MTSFEQNNISEMRTQGISLGKRWKNIFSRLFKETGFIPDFRTFRKIAWWKTNKIGSVSCQGVIRIGSIEKAAVLKIQGTKTKTSEAKIIELFSNQNKSKIVRPPKVYFSKPWDQKNKHETLILEEAKGKVSIDKHPAPEKKLENFFELYKEYRQNCRNKPWLNKPLEIKYRVQFQRWKKAVSKEMNNDIYKNKADLLLTEKALCILEDNLQSKSLEFVHGHFQPGDLLIGKANDVVLTSNLFWGWRIPFYDAVFGYHWWMLGMEHADNLTTELLEKERKRWLDKIYNLSEVKGNPKNEKLVTLALLERAIPALMIDRFMMDQTKPSAEIITKAARKELRRLVREFK